MTLTRSRQPRVLQGYFRAEQFRGAARHAGMMQPTSGADWAARAPRPDLMPGRTQGSAVLARRAAGPGANWSRAPRPDLLPGMASPRGVAQPRPSQGISTTPIPAGQLRLIGPGRPLEPGIRQAMERFFQTDFSRVRVHEGLAAQAMGALAFTLGDEIHFAPGRYDPVSREGVALLGHELAHVVQQRNGRVANPYGHGIAIVQDPALEAEADRLGSQVAAQIGSRPARSRPIVQRSVREEETVSWSCTKCQAQQTTSSKFRKPAKDGCPQDKRKGHEWKLGTTSERRQALTELHISSSTSSRPKPEHFSDAETWSEAYELLAPWGDYETAGETLEGIRLFSNVGSAQGALALYRELQGSGNWARGRQRALTAVESNEELLQHVGALCATITLTDGDTVTFFGVAANLYKTYKEPSGKDKGPRGRWVFETLSQPGCSGGTCHTEQLCLYHLHPHLVALGDRLRSVRLQWYTEKVMCTLWCVPTLYLFTAFWQDKGIVIESIPSEKL